MAYCLQAFIGDPLEVDAIPVASSPVALPQGKTLLPLTTAVRESHSIARAPLASAEGFDPGEIPAAVVAFALRTQKIAYVEAEYFGGDGMQAAAVWEAGALVFGPVVADDAINQALRALGVSKGAHSDEFAALNLGRHRDTDQWK
jgi:hypothetical protein